MNCPACDRELTRWTSPVLAVDVCAGGCGGIWFDHYELAKVDEASETAGEALLDVEHDPALQVDLDRRRLCPKCTEAS